MTLALLVFVSEGIRRRLGEKSGA